MCTARTKTVVTRDGVSLSVRDFGSADAARTIVLMHGFCLDQRTWQHHAEELVGANTRVITYDHRGHGKSEQAPIATYTLPTLADDLADVLARLNVCGEVTLAGHSMGGMTAMEYLATPREITPTGLVLVATAAGKVATRGVGKVLFTPLVNAMRAGIPVVPERIIAAYSRAVLASTLRLSVRRAAYVHHHLAEHADVAARAIAGTAYRTKIGFPYALNEFDAYAALPTIAAATLVISGGKDILTPTDHARDIVAGIPNAEHMHFPHAGHMVLHEEFDAVLNALDLVSQRARL